MPRFFYDSARWLLCAMLVFAPWAYGSTREWSAAWLENLQLGLLVLLVLVSLVRRRWPRVPPLPVLLPLLLLAYGWGMTMNANASFDPVNLKFTEHIPLAIGWPAALDFRIARQTMLGFTGLMAVLWVTCDLCSNPLWIRRLWSVISLTGVSIVFLGLLEKATGASGIFWNGNLPFFFAAYRYHGNAGSYLNLVLPFIILRTLWVFQQGQSGRARAFWTVSSAATIAAPFVNTSRGALAITLFLLAVLGGWQLIAAWRRPQAKKRLLVYYTLLGAVLVAFLAWTIGVDRIFERIERLGVEDITDNGRFIAYHAIIDKMLPETGAWGFGPGLFYAAFPFYERDVADQIPGLWRYAHHDYLQTMVEWGYTGMGVWVILIFGGLLAGVARLFRAKNRLGRVERSLLAASSLSLIGVLIHASFDFPLQVASLQLYTAVALGFAWSLGRVPMRRATDEPAKAPSPPADYSETADAGRVSRRRK